jgi:hypothetical protein
MEVEKEAMVEGGRVDFLLRLRVGVEIKNLEELASTDEVVDQISKYMGDLDALILLVSGGKLSSVTIDHVRRLCTTLPPGVAVAYGNPYNPLTWQAVCDMSLLNIVKRVIS